MKLTITTPFATVVRRSDVSYVRAEDPSGAFGILNGHAGFLTVLSVSVLTWRETHGTEHYIAVRGGMLRVGAGSTVIVATPEAVAGEDLHQLEAEVLARFRRQVEEERSARTDAQRLRLAALRRIMGLLRPQPRPMFAAGQAASSARTASGGER